MQCPAGWFGGGSTSKVPEEREMTLEQYMDAWYESFPTLGYYSYDTYPFLKEDDVPTEEFITDKTLNDFYALDKTVDYSTTAYRLEAKVFIQGYNVKLQSLDGSISVNLYSSGAGQYAFLQQYNGQVITVEIAACNWNSKSYWACCVLEVVHEDGTKTYNTLNFDN